MQLATCVRVANEHMHVATSQGYLCDKRKIKEVMDGDYFIATHKFDKRVKGELKCKRIRGDPHWMLIPQSC